MGIHGLISYIKNYDQVQLFQYESGNKIYLSNIGYFDATYKLIDIYNTFMKINKTKNYEQKVKDLLKYVEKEMYGILSKLSFINRIVYIFADYKFMTGLNEERNIIFGDFLNYEADEEEKISSIPMIKRKYVMEMGKGMERMMNEVQTIDTNADTNAISNEIANVDKMVDNHTSSSSLPSPTSCSHIDVNFLKKKVRCMFELKSTYSIADNLNVEKYVSIPYLLKKNENNEILKILLEEGKLRYLILRGAKFQTRKRRSKCLFSFLDKDCDSLDKQILKSIESGNEEKINECRNYIPFTLIIYMFPKIVENLKFENVKFLGCEIESDFAISKHIHSYSKNAFPTIYSSDTDMLVHMCDINCVVKLNDSKLLHNTYYINPVVFWEKIFGCQLSKKMIKTICVLMGTDYNPYSSLSPIHIKHFNDVLKMMNVDSFDKVDEDLFFMKIYMIMKKNEGNIYCSQTALALNMYLNDLEGDIHFICGSETNKKINLERFLKYSRRSAF